MSKKTSDRPADEPNPERPADEPNPPYPPLELETPKVDWFKKDAGEGDVEERQGH